MDSEVNADLVVIALDQAICKPQPVVDQLVSVRRGIQDKKRFDGASFDAACGIEGTAFPATERQDYRRLLPGAV